MFIPELVRHHKTRLKRRVEAHWYVAGSREDGYRIGRVPLNNKGKVKAGGVVDYVTIKQKRKIGGSWQYAVGLTATPEAYQPVSFWCQKQDKNRYRVFLQLHESAYWIQPKIRDLNHPGKVGVARLPLAAFGMVRRRSVSIWDRIRGRYPVPVITQHDHSHGKVLGDENTIAAETLMSNAIVPPVTSVEWVETTSTNEIDKTGSIPYVQATMVLDREHLAAQASAPTYEDLFPVQPPSQKDFSRA